VSLTLRGFDLKKLLGTYLKINEETNQCKKKALLNFKSYKREKNRYRVEVYVFREIKKRTRFIGSKEGLEAGVRCFK